MILDIGLIALYAELHSQSYKLVLRNGQTQELITKMNLCKIESGPSVSLQTFYFARVLHFGNKRLATTYRVNTIKTKHILVYLEIPHSDEHCYVGSLHLNQNEILFHRGVSHNVTADSSHGLVMMLQKVALKEETHKIRVGLQNFLINLHKQTMEMKENVQIIQSRAKDDRILYPNCAFDCLLLRGCCH